MPSPKISSLPHHVRTTTDEETNAVTSMTLCKFVQVFLFCCVIGRPVLGCSIAGVYNDSSDISVKKRHIDCTSQLHVAAARGLLGPALRSQKSLLLHEIKKTQEKKRIPHGLPEDGHPPWVCETRYIYQDLGQDYYPRYLRTAECPGTSCWHELYRCTPRLYKVKVLRKRSDGNDMCDRDQDQLPLPDVLKHRWTVEDLPVTVCCECSYNAVVK